MSVTRLRVPTSLTFTTSRTYDGPDLFIPASLRLLEAWAILLTLSTRSSRSHIWLPLSQDYSAWRAGHPTKCSDLRIFPARGEGEGKGLDRSVEDEGEGECRLRRPVAIGRGLWPLTIR